MCTLWNGLRRTADELSGLWQQRLYLIMKCQQCEQTSDPMRDEEWTHVSDQAAMVPLLECAECGNRQRLR